RVDTARNRRRPEQLAPEQTVPVASHSSPVAPRIDANVRVASTIGNEEIELGPQSRGVHLELQRLQAQIDLASARDQDIGNACFRAAVCAERCLRASGSERQQLTRIPGAALAIVSPLGNHCAYF